MKRLCSSDSLAGLISICPNSTEEHNQGNNPMYSREFQTMLEGFDEEGCGEESGQHSEKKRRLSVDQVKALEKNFEVENKLEPERKTKLAQELGLQPRQVAVWFQNRRARWKTKQLERDYGVLKASHDALKHKYESLQKDNESLHNEIHQLKSKLNGDGGNDGKITVKDEPSSVSDTRKKMEFDNCAPKCEEDAIEFNENEVINGSSDSDSSAILSEDNNNSPMFQRSPRHNFLDANYETQFVKIEEHNFLGEEESCGDLFSDDQPPSLHWYCSDGWN